MVKEIRALVASLQFAMDRGSITLDIADAGGASVKIHLTADLLQRVLDGARSLGVISGNQNCAENTAACHVRKVPGSPPGAAAHEGAVILAFPKIRV